MLPHAAGDREWLRQLSIEMHFSLHILIKGGDEALQVWWASNSFQLSVESPPAHQVKGLGHTDEGNIQGLLCSCSSHAAA